MNSGTRKTLIAGSIVALGTVALARTQKRRHANTDMPQATTDPAIEETVVAKPEEGRMGMFDPMEQGIE